MEINNFYKLESLSTITTQTNINFYKLVEGYYKYFGTGKYISLPNGNEYAIIGDVKYKIVFNTSLEVTYLKLYDTSNSSERT